MARLNYTTISEKDLGAGIDQQSSENQIKQGYCEDIINADPKATGQISKRKGYQAYAGCLPMRVVSVIYDGTDITFVFDGSVEIPLNQSSPIIALGTTSDADGGTGDFDNDTILYFDSYVADIRLPFGTGTSVTTITSSDHSSDSQYMFVESAISDNLITNNNTQFQPETIDIDSSTLDIDVTVQNNTGSEFNGFIFTKEKSAVPTETYIHTATIGAGSNTETILQATHQLANNNIIVQCYQDTGANLVKMYADSVSFNEVSGDIAISLTNETGSDIDVIYILSIAPGANFLTGAVASGASETVSIDISGSDATDFAFVACYLEIGGNILEQVIPDSIVTDTESQTIDVTFTNNTGNGATFEIYWDYATIATNKITVTGTNSANFTDTEPQLTVYGLCHEDTYGTREGREGWTNHIDSYRATAENRLIAGLGGNLFAARFQSELTNNLSNEDVYLMPTLLPRLNARLLNDTIIGPVFFDTGELPGITRGYVTGDNLGTNFATVSDISYNSGTGFVDYTLTIPNLQIFDKDGNPETIDNIISTTAGIEDEVTFQQCGWAYHNGVYKIEGISNPATDTLIVSVNNENVNTSDYDEEDVQGQAGIFTDKFILADDSPFLIDDILKSDLFDNTDSYEVAGNLTSSTLIRNVIEPLSLPGGLRIIAERTSEIIPLRDNTNTPLVDNIVKGDMINYTGVERQLEVKSVNVRDDISISITDNVVTLGAGDTTQFFIGKKILITGTTNYNGVQTITSITGLMTFTIDLDVGTTESGIIVGKTIEIDEQLTVSDSTNNSITIAVDSRWIPIEAPGDNFNLTPQTRTFHFDAKGFDEQEILRSTIVQDSLYITNQEDEVMKFDGVNIYRAGLYRWQPGLFISKDTTATSKIVVDNTEIETSLVSTTASEKAGYFFIDESDRGTFQVGDIFKDTSSDEYYTVRDIVLDSGPTHAHVYVDRKITAGTTPASTSLIKVSTYLYYFRLNAIDRNNNIVASATTGSTDFQVRIEENTAINIKLVGMPVFDIYDYDRLEVEIYRTQSNQIAPYYRLTTLPMEFDNDNGYLVYTDTAADEDLIDLDGTVTAIKGAELATAIGQPLRAKYCTSSGNRLILGNLKDYPTLDIRLIKNQFLANTDFLGDNSLWQFRKNNTDISSGTDMINTARYEFVNQSLAITSVTNNASDIQIQFGVAHNLNVGDWIYIYHDTVLDGANLQHSGWYQVATENGGSILTVNQANASNFDAATVTHVAYATNSGDIPVFVGIDGNYGQRNRSETTASFEFVAMNRLADAINSSMRKVDTSIAGFESFKPWMTAAAGNDFNFGQIIIKQPTIVSTDFLEVELPVLDNKFKVFVNNSQYNSTDQVSSLILNYPSRLLVSYPNYPEIFDNPNAVLDTESDSVIDINSADGQEITAIIPFFGDSAFGAAQKSGIIVVFKTNSIYLVDLSAKAAGQNAVQRLETRGKGCTAPYSVSVTKGGIIFANNTGIYKLNRNLAIEYVGEKYERKWQQQMNESYIDIATGHHDTENNQYKLSYPVSSDVENSEVAVYNHVRETNQGAGSWTTYDNHPATGWANLQNRSFFSSTRGKVYIIRDVGDITDYRDADQPINMTVLTRAMDLGMSGVRKVFGQVITHYRSAFDSIGTSLEVSLDLKSTSQTTDSFKISKNIDSNGVGDTGSQKVVSISSTFDEKVGIYVQYKYSNSTIDEPVEITGIDTVAAAKNSKGIKQAIST